VKSETQPIIPDHQLLRKIGAGSYGEIWLSQNVMGTFRAIKIVYRSSFEKERPYEREFLGIRKFEPVSRSHEGLVDILQVGRDPDDQYFYYVMEIADDVSQGQVIDAETYKPYTLSTDLAHHKPLSHERCLSVAQSLASALQYLHTNGLIHRDVKPSNIIFVGGVAKLADIGLVTEVGANTIIGGTLGYIAPDKTPSPQGDIYSLGKVLYEMSTGKSCQDFPELPTTLDDEHGQALLELNEITLKACEHEQKNRYQSAKELFEELQLLQAGKSLKRLHALEKRFVILIKLVLVVSVLLCLGGIAFWRAKEAEKQTSQRLADSYITLGISSMDNLDLFGALNWFSEALRLDEGQKDREARDRLYYGAVLQRCPKLTRLWLNDDLNYQIRFSHSDKYLVTANEKGAATIWDVANDRKKLELTNHPAAVKTASFSPDDSKVLTSCNDGYVRIWNVENGMELMKWRHPTNGLSAAFYPDGKRVVTGCADGKIRVFAIGQDSPVRVIEAHNGTILNVSCSADGKWLTSASKDGTARLWDAETYAPLDAPFKHGSWVYYANVSPDGKYLATCSFDETVKIWELPSGRMHRILEHEGAVHSAEFNFTSTLLVTTCGDYATRIYEVIDGKQVSPPLKTGLHAPHAVFSHKQNLVAVAGTHGVSSIWDIEPSIQLPKEKLAAHLDQRGHTVTLTTHSAQIIAISNSTPVGPVFSTPQNLVSVDLSQRTESLLMISTNLESKAAHQNFQLFDIKTGKVLGPKFELRASNRTLSPSGRLLLASSREGISLWDLTQGKEHFARIPRTTNQRVLSFNNGETMFAYVHENFAYIHSVKSGELLWAIEHQMAVASLLFHPDGKFVVTACSDDTFREGEAHFWDLEKRVPVGSPMVHRDGVVEVHFSPSGDKVLTCSEDRTARIWEFPSGKPLTPPMMHKNHVDTGTFSPDGSHVLTASGDLAVRMWDAATGLPITPQLYHSQQIVRLSFIGGNNVFSCWEKDKSFRVWHFAEDSRPVEDLMALSELLSGYENRNNSRVLLQNQILEDRWESLRKKYPVEFTSLR